MNHTGGAYSAAIEDVQAEVDMQRVKVKDPTIASLQIVKADACFPLHSD